MIFFRGEGCGKFILGFMKVWSKIEASWDVLFHRANTKVKHMSQSHTLVTFCVGYFLLPINIS